MLHSGAASLPLGGFLAPHVGIAFSLGESRPTEKQVREAILPLARKQWRPDLPKISEFFGIVIYVYWRDHGPPHFHAIYGDDEVLISIEGLSILEGKVSPRVMGLVVEWAALHQDELRQVWKQAANLEPLDKIAPLQ